MRKLFLSLALIECLSINALSQTVFRNLDSEYVVFSEQIDSVLLKKQIQHHESKLKKLFLKTNRHIDNDSLLKMINHTFYYYVCCFEIVSEKKDTIFLKPYHKQTIKYFKLLFDNLELGSFGSLNNLTMKKNYGCIRCDTINKPELIFSYYDMAYSALDLYYYEQLFKKNIFAIKDYVEDNLKYDFFWFYINKQGRLEKIYNLDIK